MAAIELLGTEAFEKYNIDDIKSAFDIKYTFPELRQKSIHQMMK